MNNWSEEINALIVDYLDDALCLPERQAFEELMRTVPSLGADVRGLQRTIELIRCAFRQEDCDQFN